MDKSTLLLFAVTSLLTINVFAEERLVIPPVSSTPFDLTTYTSVEVNSLCKEAEAARTANDFKKSNELLESAAQKTTSEDIGKIHNLMGLSYVQQKDYVSAEKHWQLVANRRVKAGDDQVGYARLRLAYVKLHNGKKEAACEAFREIALGYAPADNSTAVDASQRYARLLQNNGKLVQAKDLYAQLAASPNVSEKTKIEAKVELAGVLWEIGKGDYSVTTNSQEKSGYMLESRKVCEDLMATPNIPEDKLVIAELLNIETYYFQDEFATSEKLSEDFLKKWESSMNKDGKTLKYQLQVAAARGWVILSSYRQGKIEKTLELCTKLADNPDMCKSYDNFLVHAIALHYKALCLEDMGKTEKAAETRSLFEKQYPDYAQYSARFDEQKLEKYRKEWKR